MALASAEEYLSDYDETDDVVFFGKLSLKEIKKRIFLDRHTNRKLCTKDDNNLSLTDLCDIKEEEDQNKSIRLIESHSQPNLCCNSPCPKIRPSEASFLEMELMVDKLCASPRKSDTNQDLNNTLEIVEYILKRGPGHNMSSDSKIKIKSEENTKLEEDQEKKEIIQEHKMVHTPSDSSVKMRNKLANDEVFKTPSTNTKQKHIFKTPSSAALSNKKPSASSVKKTPLKIATYQHISSPVASYINNCPRVPLLKDVHPKKPLPGMSSIPKIIKNPVLFKATNKENVNLPSVAYKSAKKTKLIDLPDEHRLPQSHWTKKTTSTLPRPLIIKHDHREMAPKNREVPQVEDSFANLSIQQAEVSVCTQKSAFKAKKNI